MNILSVFINFLNLKLLYSIKCTTTILYYVKKPLLNYVKKPLDKRLYISITSTLINMGYWDVTVKNLMFQ